VLCCLAATALQSKPAGDTDKATQAAGSHLKASHIKHSSSSQSLLRRRIPRIPSGALKVQQFHLILV